MYTVDPIGKTKPYGSRLHRNGRRGRYFPPWNGPVGPLAQPDDDGHFDHLEPGEPGFAAAHLFGATRFTLDVWEGYLGHRIVWHFNRRYDRLELSMLDNWRNGRMGYGYLEVGSWRTEEGEWHDYALNFDLISHEVGHAILSSLIQGGRRSWTGEFEALHEMSADWVALISTLHFPSVIERVLENTRGNLDTFNRLSRFAETSPDRQVRLANNTSTMSDFRHGWESEHDLALPLIGVFFDIFVDIYHEFLIDSDAISENVAALADRAEDDPRLRPQVQIAFDFAYAQNPHEFRRALLAARDAAAHMLIEIWLRTDPTTFSFKQVPAWISRLDKETHGGRFSDILLRNFEYREILSFRPGPRIYSEDQHGHADSPRFAVPGHD